VFSSRVRGIVDLIGHEFVPESRVPVNDYDTTTVLQYCIILKDHYLLLVHHTVRYDTTICHSLVNFLGYHTAVSCLFPPDGRTGRDARVARLARTFWDMGSSVVA